jgi:hypothetical protein
LPEELHLSSVYFESQHFQKALTFRGYSMIARSHRIVPRLGAVTLLAPFFLTASCQPLQVGQEEQVAKNWCLAIRANQVIPVYPLTEDLLPGDTFLVQRSIANQQADYEAKGFLPLDDHRNRISVIDYKALYFDGFWQDQFGKVPHPRPDRRANAGPTTAAADSSVTLTDIPAPRATFPSYTFTVSRSQGLSLAIPVHAIPVAFNYLGADNATGTVTLLDSHTYAADSYDLEFQLRAWAAKDKIKNSLAQAAAMSPDKTVYLRCITRVYLIGGVAVSLTNSDSQGAKVTAGVNPPGVPNITPTADAGTNYTNLLQQLSNQSNGVSTNPSASKATGLLTSAAQIGGSVQFTQASSLGVSLNETFDRPLVVGYLGFDIAVNPDGELGPRVPTFDVLKTTGGLVPTNAVPGTFVELDANSTAIRAWLKADDSSHTRREALRAWLKQHKESSITVWLYGGKTEEYTEAMKDLSIPTGGA